MKILSADIRQEFDWIKPGLEDIHRRTNPEWRVEDIYAACRFGKAFLFIDGFGANSFVVLTTGECPYRAKRVLFVLAAWSDEGDAVTKYLEEIEKIGREAGCKEIEFSSPRRGWEKLGEANGFETVCTTFRKAL